MESILIVASLLSSRCPFSCWTSSIEARARWDVEVNKAVTYHQVTYAGYKWPDLCPAFPVTPVHVVKHRPGATSFKTTTRQRTRGGLSSEQSTKLCARMRLSLFKRMRAPHGPPETAASTKA
ncbi:hypothetical protein T265_00405 [Opisthorchis viverrini]|uniref:Uncharacterized protein n=1 Tax=Opisthorchis viverrini TaxID=6198 RepID=A0A075A5Z3_OPIVI|nr:hypothetical protein T265_00405 [Opisthorchis viverrini]KER33717.1 hypothetical protein T265_00405 [Opisthorchis viverrini]